MTFYNDIEPYAAEWLRNLIAAGHISPGEVSEESISDLEGWQLSGFDRCHFFAGIGGWDYALQLAGWPVDLPVWTGSCPCQPFSVAGKRRGEKDERHLWPAFRSLIEQCQPPIVFGEQVAGKDGRLWLAGVRSDLEALGYVVGAADLCAAGVSAPHIRQRLYWVAYADSMRHDGRGELQPSDEKSQWREAQERRINRREAERYSDVSGLGNADEPGSQGRIKRGNGAHKRIAGQAGVGFIGLPGQPREPRGTFWSAYDAIPCADGKARRVEPGTFPLAHGVPRRVDKLRGYGNAIVPQVAAEFIRSVMDVLRIR